MGKLTGQTIAASYDQLLIVDDANGISSSLQAVESADTGGSASALQISTVAAAIDNPTTSSATQGGKLTLFSDDGAALGDTHRLGVLEFSAAEDTGSTITIGARIEAIADAAWSASENGADMVFYTTDGNASQAEQFRLTADGNHSIRGFHTFINTATTGSVTYATVQVERQTNADNDGVGIGFSMGDSTGVTEKKEYAYIGGVIEDRTDDGEDGQMFIGVMKAGTQRTEMVRVTGTGVGIGTAAPGALIDSSTGGYTDAQVHAIKIGANLGANTARTDGTRKMGSIVGAHYDNDADDITLMRIDSEDSSNQILSIGGTGEMNGATQINFYTAANATATPATKMSITSAGDVDVESGDIFFSTAGKGICLGVTSNTDSNTLDDYEEGTWTPTLASDAGPTSYTTQTGYYTRIGRVVHVEALVQLDVIGGFTGATINVSSLPFTVADLTNHDVVGIAVITDAATAKADIFLRFIDANDYARLEEANGSTTSAKNMNANAFDGDTKLRIAGTYIGA